VARALLDKGNCEMKNAAPATFANHALSCVAALMATAGLVLMTGCAATPRSIKSAPAGPPSPAAATIGMASYYGKQYHGRKTASGEIYDMNKMTAAHRTLPFGVRVRVTELSSQRSVVVRINDRGPFARDRIIDVSLAAARRLGMIQSGHVNVKLEVMSQISSKAAGREHVSRVSSP